MFSERSDGTAEKGILLVLGPIFGILYVALLPLIAFLTLAIVVPQNAFAKKTSITESSPMCMTCHSSRGLSKVFKNGEKMSVHVIAKDFANSVHEFLKCNDCHMKISMATHPGRPFDSKKAFALDSSASCRRCHTDASLQAKPIHAYLANKTSNGPPCIECHGAHTVRRVADWKPAAADNDYCLTCHSQKLSKQFTNGEELSLSIDPKELKSSVHGGHACFDCHSGFSRKTHPVQKFGSSREHSIAVSQACRNCHDDKYMAVSESIHYKMISGGNLDAPVCTDCHGFHNVGPKATYDTLSGVPCRKCHEQVFNMYAKSVHGMAKAGGEHKAPLCSSCHFAHEVKTTTLTEKIRNACLGCHANVETAHREWLPNADLHLSVVSCASCHSPNSQKGIFLKLYDEANGEPFSDEQISQLLGIRYEDFSERMNAHGEGIDSGELWGIVKQLNEKGAGAKVTYLGRMDLMNGSDAHQLAVKGQAVKQCENCHTSTSEFFDSVTVAVVKADGGVTKYKARPEVLGSMVSLMSLKQFYVLGSTRLKVVDWLGILMVAGGACVPIGHITLRILTSPIREAKRLNKMRKGVKK